jgi:hypothetical protein
MAAKLCRQNKDHNTAEPVCSPSVLKPRVRCPFLGLNDFLYESPKGSVTVTRDIVLYAKYRSQVFYRQIKNRPSIEQFWLSVCSGRSCLIAKPASSTSHAAISWTTSRSLGGKSRRTNATTSSQSTGFVRDRYQSNLMITREGSTPEN